VTLSLDFLTLPLLAAAALVFISVLAGVFSARAGFSFLLVFLVVGMLAGEDGPGGFQFDDFRLSFWVGNVALAVILLDGGLRTELSTFRTGLRPSILLATVGVVITAGLTGAARTGCSTSIGRPRCWSGPSSDPPTRPPCSRC
jgi:potassium/hydrogen antiporter